MTAKTETKQTNVVNGVDVDQLKANIGAIQQQPVLAKFRFRANNQWLGGGLNRSAIGEFEGVGQTHKRAEDFVLDNAEPPVLLGQDQAPNPVEYVLHALAGCLTTGLVYHAAARGIRLDEVESQLEGEMDLRGFLGLTDEVRRGYEKIRVVFRIKSDAPREKLEELFLFSKQISPVFDIVTNGVPVSVELAK